MEKRKCLYLFSSFLRFNQIISVRFRIKLSTAFVNKERNERKRKKKKNYTKTSHSFSFFLESRSHFFFLLPENTEIKKNFLPFFPLSFLFFFCKMCYLKKILLSTISSLSFYHFIILFLNLPPTSSSFSFFPYC